MRVKCPKDDHVVFIPALAQKVPGVVIDEMDLRRGVRMVGIESQTQGVEISGSISTASTREAPCRNAGGISFPAPEPMTRTLFVFLANWKRLS